MRSMITDRGGTAIAAKFRVTNSGKKKIEVANFRCISVYLFERPPQRVSVVVVRVRPAEEAEEGVVPVGEQRVEVALVAAEVAPL